MITYQCVQYHDNIIIIPSLFLLVGAVRRLSSAQYLIVKYNHGKFVLADPVSVSVGWLLKYHIKPVSTIWFQCGFVHPKSQIIIVTNNYVCIALYL